MTTSPTGILLLAYGSPDTPNQVEPYFRHIRGGRAPSPEAVENLQQRYALIGGRTPLLAITTETARHLQTVLDARSPGEYRTYVAMKHWHPFIGDVIPTVAADGVRRLGPVGVPTRGTPPGHKGGRPPGATPWVGGGPRRGHSDGWPRGAG